MDEKNLDNFLFDDRELNDEEYIDGRNFKPIIDEVIKNKIDDEIQEILNNMKIEYED